MLQKVELLLVVWPFLHWALIVMGCVFLFCSLWIYTGARPMGSKQVAMKNMLTTGLLVLLAGLMLLWGYALITTLTKPDFPLHLY